jgi:single-strand DNA-binding protein
VSSLNKIILIGTLETTPEVRVTNAGDSFSKFTLKVDRPDKNDGTPSQTDTIDIVAWRQVADQSASLEQGEMLMVEGRIVTRTTEDEAGRKKYFTEVDAKEIKQMAGAPAEKKKSEKKPAEKKTVEKKNIEEIQESDFDFGSKSFEKAPSFTQESEEVPF